MYIDLKKGPFNNIAHAPSYALPLSHHALLGPPGSSGFLLLVLHELVYPAVSCSHHLSFIGDTLLILSTSSSYTLAQLQMENWSVPPVIILYLVPHYQLLSVHRGVYFSDDFYNFYHSDCNSTTDRQGCFTGPTIKATTRR